MGKERLCVLRTETRKGRKLEWKREKATKKGAINKKCGLVV
jgi:hypothetical protein